MLSTVHFETIAPRLSTSPGSERVILTHPERVFLTTLVVKMAALGKSGNPLSLGLPALLRFHRLAEPIALTIHLENVAMVGEAVQECRGHPLSLEDLVPLAERQIARHQDAAAP